MELMGLASVGGLSCEELGTTLEQVGYSSVFFGNLHEAAEPTLIMSWNLGEGCKAPDETVSSVEPTNVVGELMEASRSALAF